SFSILLFYHFFSMNTSSQERPAYGMNGCVSFDGWQESTNFTLDDFDGTVLTVIPSKDYDTMTITQYFGDATLEKVVIHLKGSAVTTDSTTEVTTTTTAEQTTTITTTTVTTVTTGESLPVGDVSGDGKTDLTDLILLQKYLVRRGTLTEEQAQRADLNADNRLNVVDAILLRRLLLQES
ncbi:MAG: dockerin type I repeat-containing protein, partial [Oscillospiraceae bacterium]|nr:dockerin type I repeat-containing protein [Oscillospiraceae bacterium]